KMLADELGLDFDKEINHQLRGVSRVESLKRIYRHNNRELPPEDAFNAQMAKKNDKYVDLIGTMKPEDILPGSLELLRGLRDQGIKCAIASASKNTPKVLAATGLDEHVDGVADGNQAKKSKPDPEVFLLAANNIGCAPENCIGVEDAEAGIEAIQRAHMVSVGIGESAGQGDLVVGGVAELSVDILKNLFAEKAAG
ncbi:MAG: HAD-IA family hydrolase, partial [Chitinivibrionales bacterium]|nr:HAD-IA family hydrolase [Chitinivibrionales bacterium]MBD3395215.1 HAD-IA family hydrolase [Chitinivibrionales bacterium]